MPYLFACSIVLGYYLREDVSKLKHILGKVSNCKNLTGCKPNKLIAQGIALGV